MKLLVSFHYPVVKVPATRTPCSREYHPLGRPPAAKSMISDITRKGQALSAHSPQSTGLQARHHPPPFLSFRAREAQPRNLRRPPGIPYPVLRTWSKCGRPGLSLAHSPQSTGLQARHNPPDVLHTLTVLVYLVPRGPALDGQVAVVAGVGHRRYGEAVVDVAVGQWGRGRSRSGLSRARGPCTGSCSASTWTGTPARRSPAPCSPPARRSSRGCCRDRDWRGRTGCPRRPAGEASTSCCPRSSAGGPLS